MRKYILLGAFVLLASGPAYGAESIDLERYLTLVRDHNRDLALADKDRELADLDEKEATSAALPRVGLSTNYNYNITDYYMYFDKSAMAPGATGIIKAPIRRDNEYGATLALEQTLYSPVVRNAITAASQYRSLTGFVFDAASQNVLAASKKLYYQCLMLEHIAEVARASEENAHDNYLDAERKFDNGQLSQLELLLAETRWHAAVPAVQQAERNVTLAMNTLRDLAGIDLERDIELTGSLDDIPALPGPVTVDEVIEARPDYQALVWEERLRSTAVDAASNARRPTVTGTVAYAYSGQSDRVAFEEQNNLLFAGVTLSIPIYTGGAIAANVEKARVERDKTTVRMEKTRDAIAIDLKNNRLRLQEALGRIESAETTRRTAERAFGIAETATREGLTTQLDLKDARLSFDQSVVNYYAAVYDYLAAYADWELTVGRAAAAPRARFTRTDEGR